MPDLSVHVGYSRFVKIPEVCVNKLQELRERYPDLNLQFEDSDGRLVRDGEVASLCCRIDIDGESWYQYVYGTTGWDNPTAALEMMEEAMCCLPDWAKAKRYFNPEVWDEADLIRLGKIQKESENG